ncbi:hypothetical protein [Pectobacterium betavasculorum]|uniref:hypothetical protein n=1 Tax=Pectobacterium betavasculorum TaxID=55207 RepID=UPI000ACE6BB5|nr:hypothetical protein [Pectobacterium betavasculorum]
MNEQVEHRIDADNLSTPLPPILSYQSLPGRKAADPIWLMKAIINTIVLNGVSMEKIRY